MWAKWGVTYEGESVCMYLRWFTFIGAALAVEPEPRLVRDAQERRLVVEATLQRADREVIPE